MTAKTTSSVRNTTIRQIMSTYRNRNRNQNQNRTQNRNRNQPPSPTFHHFLLSSLLLLGSTLYQ